MENLKYGEILKQNALLKKKVFNQKEYKVLVLSNIICNQLGAILTYHLCCQNINPTFTFGNYDNIVQDSYDVADYDLVIIHYELIGILDKMDFYYENLSTRELNILVTDIKAELGIILENVKNVPCVLFDRFHSNSISINPFRKNVIKKLAKDLNSYVFNTKFNNTYLIDTQYVISTLGNKYTFDFRLYGLSKTLYTIAYWKEYTYMISPIILKNTGHIKKAIIFDCDNTLWKGILGEDGFSGIDMSFHSKIGMYYHSVQQIAVWLSKQGVLIGLCSKNNFEDVNNVLINHPDMVLKNDNIVVSEINWDNKALNLRLVAEELNIGLDSILFVDDSSFEINLIKEQLPQVLCFQVPEVISDYPRKFLDLVNSYFYFSGSKADLDKTNQYKQQTERNKAKKQFTDIDSYLTSLSMEVLFHVDDSDDVERVAQLSQKTNQFNLCTNRYTLPQIEAIKNEVNRSYVSVFVKDKYGNMGLTGAIIVSYEKEIAHIDDFLMSCRIMGRKIELSIADYLMNFLMTKGITRVNAFYVPTLKNKPVEDFYNSLGFKEESNNGGRKSYTIDLVDYKYSKLNFIKIKQ